MKPRTEVYRGEGTGGVLKIMQGSGDKIRVDKLVLVASQGIFTLGYGENLSHGFLGPPQVSSLL